VLFLPFLLLPQHSDVKVQNTSTSEFEEKVFKEVKLK
jgi:hypothetical protein